MIKISEQGPTISEHDIGVVEKMIGSVLPSVYRQFLLSNNGGRPSPDTIDIDQLPGTPTDIKVFFGFSRKIETSNLQWNFGLTEDWRKPCIVLPIANDSGGGLFCLHIDDGRDLGVFYYEWGTYGQGFYEVAKSFDEFLSKIREF